MRQGFTLMEVLIAIAISSAVLAAVFNMFYQINKSVAVAERIAGTDMRVSLLQHQLERDVSGIFIPMVVQKKGTKGERAKEEKKPKEKAKKPTEKSSSAKASEDKKEELIPLEKAFHVEVKEKNTTLLTFITSNPLPAYNTLKSRLVRVAYKLEEDKEAERMWGKGTKSYKLFRQEAPVLSYAAFTKQTKKSAAKYELVDNIKSFEIQYVVEIIKKDKKDEKAKPKIEYKTYKTWGKKQIKESKKQRPDFFEH